MVPWWGVFALQPYGHQMLGRVFGQVQFSILPTPLFAKFRNPHGYFPILPSSLFVFFANST
jgi:hypothetical protein